MTRIMHIKGEEYTALYRQLVVTLKPFSLGTETQDSSNLVQSLPGEADMVGVHGAGGGQAGQAAQPLTNLGHIMRAVEDHFT